MLRSAGRGTIYARTLVTRAPSPELRALVSARGPLWASYASGAMLFVLLALMVWQPG